MKTEPCSVNTAYLKTRRIAESNGTNMASDWTLRKEICEAGRRIHQRGLVGGTDGNISALAGGGLIMITPSGSCLGMMEPGDLVLIDSTGRAISGHGKPSTEHWMHATAYAQRPDVTAIVHAHPPLTVAFTVAGLSMAPCALPEVIIAFGHVPVTAYATPCTDEGANVIRDLIKQFDVLVLDRHGSLTVGKSVMDAMYKLEKLEHAAQVMLTAHQLGGIQNLPPEEVAKLAGIRTRMGLGRAEDIAPACLPPACGGTANPGKS